MTEILGRFNWHPDPSIDFCCEVDALEGLALDVKSGLINENTFNQRLEKALSFRVGGCLNAIKAKEILRELAARGQ